MNPDPETQNKGNILIVDDLPENLQLLSDALLKLGYTVRSVTSGRMALKTVQVKQPDVILLDVKMPEPVIARVFGKKREDIIGKLVLKKLLNRIDPQLFDRFVKLVETGETLQQDFYYESGQSSWFHFVAVKLGDGFAITIRDITAPKQAKFQLQQQAESLELTLRELKRTQAQLIHSEKMSSIGNLVAGVAHEINNPVNFIHANLIPATQYFQDVLDLIKIYQENFPDPPAKIKAQIDTINLDFLKKDLIKLLNSMRTGTVRIQEIVRSLRNFSRHDESELKRVDIHQGIDSTLMILQHRLKATPEYPEIVVIKDYAQLPAIECYSGQLNQVFMHLLNNAIDSVSTQSRGEQGEIKVQTKLINSNRISIKISDNGLGIPQELQSKLFDPFFTTKAVGKGTGLGLFICHKIVVNQHGGNLYCHSTLGQGAEFVVEISPKKTSNKTIK
jgi:two-component system, NtrC family, sensor kinase